MGRKSKIKASRKGDYQSLFELAKRFYEAHGRGAMLIENHHLTYCKLDRIRNLQARELIKNYNPQDQLIWVNSHRSGLIEVTVLDSNSAIAQQQLVIDSNFLPRPKEALAW